MELFWGGTGGGGCRVGEPLNRTFLARAHASLSREMVGRLLGPHLNGLRLLLLLAEPEQKQLASQKSPVVGLSFSRHPTITHPFHPHFYPCSFQATPS